MLTSYTGCWGSFLLRGIALMLFGAVAIAAPHAAMEVMVLMLAIVLVVSGANTLSTGLRLRRLSDNAWLLMLEGALELVLGALAFIRPGPFVLTLAFFVAALALLNGLMQLGLAWRHRRGPSRPWLIAVIGLASVAFAGLLAWQPYAVAQGLAALVGVAALLLGGLLTVAGLRLRGARRQAMRHLRRDLPPTRTVPRPRAPAPAVPLR